MKSYKIGHVTHRKHLIGCYVTVVSSRFVSSRYFFRNCFVLSHFGYLPGLRIEVSPLTRSAVEKSLVRLLIGSELETFSPSVSISNSVIGQELETAISWGHWAVNSPLLLLLASN